VNGVEAVVGKLSALLEDLAKNATTV
jgi:hypothetical protein